MDALRQSHRPEVPLGQSSHPLRSQSSYLPRPGLCLSFLIDRFGPRAMIFLSGLIVVAAWILSSYADSLILHEDITPADTCDGGTGDGADAGNAHQPDRTLVSVRDLPDLCRNHLDARIKLPPVSCKVLDEMHHASLPRPSPSRRSKG